MLDIFLSDGKLTEIEVRDLLKLAGDAGLGSSQLQEIHLHYISQLEKLALSDGVLDKDELKQLERIRELLYIP